MGWGQATEPSAPDQQSGREQGRIQVSSMVVELDADAAARMAPEGSTSLLIARFVAQHLRPLGGGWRFTAERLSDGRVVLRGGQS